MNKYELGTWNLKGLVANPKSHAFEKQIQLVERKAKQFEKIKSKLNPKISSKKFLEILHELEELDEKMSIIGGYASLTYSGDTQSDEATSLLTRMTKLGSEISNRTLFFDLWWKRGIDEKNAKRLIKDSGELSGYLKYKRLVAKYSLSEPEERIINTLDVTGSTALIKLYDKITNAFEYVVKIEGKKRKLTREQLSTYVRSTKSKTREIAYKELLSKFSKKVFIENHVDSSIRQGKRDGAFCSTLAPKITPYVLVNFAGKSKDVFTVAHELGHAVHNMAASDKSILVSDAPLPLAETASTFSELLLYDNLSDKISADEKKIMLSEKIDDLYATIMRQSFFTLFEIEVHKQIAQSTTIEEISKAYSRNLKEQFGNSVDTSDDFALEWSCIPHFFHTPFYCYAYSFGNLLALSLFQRYKKEGQDFVSLE